MAATYCTIAEVKANTQNASLIALTDAQITALIEKAEIYIDALAGFWEKYVATQTRRFPRQQDVNSSGSSFIPDAVKYATIAQVEFIYLKTPDAEHGIQEDDKPTNMTISPRARELLRGYICRFGKIVFRRGQDENPDTSLYL